MQNLDLSDDEGEEDADNEAIHRRAFNLKDGIQWIKENGKGRIGFNKVLSQAGNGDLKVGAKRLLPKVIEGVTISPSEHIKLLVNWQLKQLEQVGAFGGKK